jgi:hypothetical protein
VTARAFEDSFTGAIHEATSTGNGGGATLRLAGVLADLPTALLVARTG